MNQDNSKSIDEIPYRRLPLIDGSFRKVDKNAVVGYCNCNLHKGYLSVTLLKEHDCIKKNCVYLKKFEDCPFWTRYKNELKLKEKRKQDKKNRIRKQEEHKAAVEEKMNSLMESAQSIADKLSYQIIITRVAPRYDKVGNYEYIVNYVYEYRYDDWSLYFDLALMLSRCYGGKYMLRHMKMPDGSYITVSDWEGC